MGRIVCRGIPLHAQDLNVVWIMTGGELAAAARGAAAARLSEGEEALRRECGSAGGSVRVSVNVTICHCSKYPFINRFRSVEFD